MLKLLVQNLMYLSTPRDLKFLFHCLLVWFLEVGSYMNHYQEFSTYLMPSRYLINACWLELKGGRYSPPFGFAGPLHLQRDWHVFHLGQSGSGAIEELSWDYRKWSIWLKHQCTRIYTYKFFIAFVFENCVTRRQ